MSKNIELNGITYEGVSSVNLPTSDGGTASFLDSDEIPVAGGVSTADFEAFKQEVKDAIGTTLTETEVPDEPDEPDEPETPGGSEGDDGTEGTEETIYLDVVIRERWFGSPTPTVSNARARSERIERTDNMKALVFGSGFVSQTMYGSDDGVTLTSLTEHSDLTEFDLTSVKYKYLYIDIKKAVSSTTPFTDEDDVSQAIGIVVTSSAQAVATSETTVTKETLRPLGKEVGDLNDLETEDKSSIVKAINEVAGLAKNIPAQGGTDGVRDAIGYVNVGETSSALIVTPRQRYNGNTVPTTFAKRAVASAYTKSANDYKIVVDEGYCICGVWVTADGINLTQIYEFSTFINEFDISDVPVGYTLFIEIAKNDLSEFSTTPDILRVVSIVSYTTNLRTLDCVSTPADIMANVLINNRGTGKNLKIKLLGDSITHGVGSNDFAYGEETVVIQQGGTARTFYRNVGSKCWASKFASYMSSKYGASVINNGLSGIKSTEIINNWDVLVDGDEDLIICMIGTNDRLEYNDLKLIDTFYKRMSTIVRFANYAGIPIILMSVIPVSAHYETHTADGVEHTFTMHAEDIENIIHQVAYNNHIGYVSMFNGMFEYCDYTDTSVDDLLDDQLHPNNDGHNLMYNILMRTLGLGRKIDGATW